MSYAMIVEFNRFNEVIVLKQLQWKFKGLFQPLGE